MCGILGIFSADPSRAEDVRRHVSSLRHRGPDLQRTEAGPGFAFGHTLLSIIGRSPVEQPITSADGAVTVTFNGEIYNYVELLAADPALAARCSSTSDTEVLVEGLALHGIDFVEKLNGIFAFAAYEHRTGTGHLVRDRLGVKPLYYATSKNGGAPETWFCSELRPLREMAGTSAAPDVEAYYSYARFRYPLGTRTFDRAIRMLPAGAVMTVREGRRTTRTYWDITEPEPWTGGYEDARDEAKALFLDAVRIQMRSDHSFCTYLSGGLDSSYLTAIAKQTKDRLDTYSIGLPVEGFDESEHAQMLAERLGTTHHPYLLTAEEYREHHELLVRHLGMPVGVPNQVALEVLSRELSRDHRCVLSGEGADEVFGGYGRIFLLPVDWERLQEVARGASGGVDTSAIGRRLAARYGRADFADYPALFLRRYGYLTHEEACDLLRPQFDDASLQAAGAAVEGDIRAMFDRWETDLYTRQLLLFQKVHLPGLLLRLDTATMTHSVEGRVPFLDHRVVELMNRLPIHYKMKRRESFDAALSEGLLSDELSEVHDTPKSLLKEIASELLPERIVGRRKLGFPIPREYYEAAAGHAGPGPGPGPGADPRTDADTGTPYLAWVRRNLELSTGVAAGGIAERERTCR